jgi:3' terminal RNA ribose 2'-O-methyltransferase Hen1
MYLSISTTHHPATDLGYLLHKNPARAQSFTLSFGLAHVFYPQVSEERCTATLLLDVDVIGLVRAPGREGRLLADYVNDRPYVASSYLSVAIAQVLSSALNGKSKERAQLVETAIPLEAVIGVLPCRGGEPMLRRLFEPLGYNVQVEQFPLDEKFPDWGESTYFRVTLTGTVRLADLLTHLYVLIPALDAGKHYAIGDDEVAKLIRKGETWLPQHPERELIVQRYLKHRRSLVREAIAQLATEDEPDEDEDVPPQPVQEARLSLHDQRLGAVLAVLKQSGAQRVLDLGCGEGRLIAMLLKDRQFTDILGMDVSYRALETARDRLHIDTMPQIQQERIRLVHGSLIYRDRRLDGFDAAAIVEVIEHLDLPRLAAFERCVFEFARPGMVVLTTPNVEYNPKFEGLSESSLRHGDHRFEWTRAELSQWADGVAERHGYTVEYLPIGPVDPEVGAPTQMAVFRRQR